MDPDSDKKKIETDTHREPDTLMTLTLNTPMTCVAPLTPFTRRCIAPPAKDIYR